MSAGVDVGVARRSGPASWVNGRTTLGAALFTVSLLAGMRMMAAGQETTAMWVATRDLARGAVIAESDLRAEDVRLAGQLGARYVHATRSLVGAVLSRPVLAGELLSTAVVQTPSVSDAGRWVTVPVTPEHAVGGAIRPGEMVDVYATFDAQDLRARTVLVARGVEVVDVVTAGGLGLGEDAIVGITVSVDARDAGRLAFAVRTGDVDIVKVLGGGSSAGSRTVRATDFR